MQNVSTKPILEFLIKERVTTTCTNMHALCHLGIQSFLGIDLSFFAQLRLKSSGSARRQNVRYCGQKYTNQTLVNSWA
jgi:hypothetical protein